MKLAFSMVLITLALSVVNAVGLLGITTHPKRQSASLAAKVTSLVKATGVSYSQPDAAAVGSIVMDLGRYHGAAWADVCGDGFLDIFVAKLQGVQLLLLGARRNELRRPREVRLSQQGLRNLGENPHRKPDQRRGPLHWLRLGWL